MAGTPLLPAEEPTKATEEATPNQPTLIKSDKTLSLDYGTEHVILRGALQPFYIRTSSGTMFLQGQLREKPVEGKRISYPAKIATVISRNDGESWARVPLAGGEWPVHRGRHVSVR